MSDIDLFAPAQMSRREVAQYNRRVAHPAGMHLCPECLRELPRTDAYFNREPKVLKSGQRAIKSVCRECTNRIGREHKRQLYASDEAFRQRSQDYSRSYYRALSPSAKQAKSLKRSQRKQERRESACSPD